MTSTFGEIWRDSGSIEDGIVICLSDEHSSKVFPSISVTDGGIEICSSDEQPEKTELPISFSEDGCSNVTSVNDEQLLNAYQVIFVTEEGMVTDRRRK